MPVTADGSGNLAGHFLIPPNIRAGTKPVEIHGSAGTVAAATFTGSGELITEVKQRVTVNSFVGQIDPLAQTFSVAARTQVAGIDLWVGAVGTTPITVQIRETSVGFPTQTLLAVVRKAPGALTANAINRFLLPYPVTLRDGQEYALVVMCDDATGSVGIAELGKQDIPTDAWVTSQPYQIGVLLSSSNASTWTPHQDRDLTFTLLKYQYTSTTRTIDLGVVAVTAVTDLMILAAVQNPDESTSVTFEVTVPTTPTPTVLTVAANQPIALAAAVTGDVGVRCMLNGSVDFSPILFPGTQVAYGVIGSPGTYITRAETSGAGARVRVIVEGLIPAGASIAVAIADGAALSTFYSMGSPITTLALDNGWREYVYEVADIDTPIGHSTATVRSKLTLTGTTAARAYARNFRMIVM